MKQLNHAHIIRLYEVIETPKELYLVLEYAPGGELFDYLVGHGRMKEKDARALFRQIVAAIRYCHKNHVVHRDLKAENLLLDLDMNVKLADFGFGRQFEEDSLLATWCGTPRYAAPELFRGEQVSGRTLPQLPNPFAFLSLCFMQYSGPAVDVWSLGVTLYILVCGTLPFYGATLEETKDRVMTGHFEIKIAVPKDCAALIKKMLVVDPAQRITIEEIWVGVLSLHISVSVTPAFLHDC